MIKEGALDNPKPAAIFGLHIWSQAPAGKIHYTSGSRDRLGGVLHVTIRGKRAHAATPHLGIDPIVIAAQCVTSLQTIRSRRVDPFEPMVLTFGSHPWRKSPQHHPGRSHAWKERFEHWTRQTRENAPQHDEADAGRVHFGVRRQFDFSGVATISSDLQRSRVDSS